MDFHTLSRKELQTLCKKNKIPANITNLAMADALAALPQVEGLDEFLNPTEADGGSGTPDTHHRTATRRKAMKEEGESRKVCSRVGRGSRTKNVEFEEESNVIPPSSRRRPLPVSTRRKKEEDGDEKNMAQLQTPAAPPSSRSRATGRTPRGGTGTTSVVNTRRSVRLLEKNLCKMSLLDTEDMGSANIDHTFSEQEFSNVSHQTEDSSETQTVNDAGASLQTVSAVVSEETDELEVSSLEKNTEDEECQSLDAGSEIQLVSGTENDVTAGLKADPQEEGFGKVNCLEAEPHDSNLKVEVVSETCDDSNEADECCDDLVVDLKQSIVIGEAVPEDDDNEAGSELLCEPENKDSLGNKQEALSAEASEDVAALSVEITDDASLEVADQCVAGSVPMSSASGDSMKPKELVEWNTDNQGSNEDDDNQDKDNETAYGNYIQNFEPMFDGDGNAAAEKDLASPEGVLGLVSSNFCFSGEHQVEELKMDIDSEERDSEDSEEHDSDSEESEEHDSDSEDSEEHDFGSEYSEEHAFDDSGAYPAVLAVEMDATFKNSATVIESCFESSADKSIMDAENVTLESSLLDVGVHEAEDLKDNSEILESKAEAEETEEHAVGEETVLDAASAFPSVLDAVLDASSAFPSEESEEHAVGEETVLDAASAFPQIPQQISVGSTGNSNTLVDGDVISEEIPIPKQESIVLAETCDIPIQSIVADQLNEESLFPAQSETKGFANEIQTVPKMTNTEDNKHNVNVMKENLTTDELEKKSIRELKKLLKNLTLDGKSNCKSETNNVVKEVEKKRTALQALPENRMTNREAQNAE